MDMEELRVQLRYRVGARLFRLLVEQFEPANGLVRDANVLRLPGYRAQFGDLEERLAQRIVALLSADSLAPPDIGQIAAETGGSRAKVLDVLGVLERQQTLVRVSSDMYFLADAIARVKSATREYFVTHDGLTPAAFRDLLGTSRKYTIPLLEYLDRDGVTVRVGDVRRLKRQTLTRP